MGDHVVVHDILYGFVHSVSSFVLLREGKVVLSSREVRKKVKKRETLKRRIAGSMVCQKFQLNFENCQFVKLLR